MFFSLENIQSNTHLLVSETIINNCWQKASVCFPKEYGGILIGIHKENYTFIFDAPGAIKFRNSKSLFTRFPDGLNEQLKKAWEQGNNDLVYLGEWHSHPQGKTLPSQKDLKTMLALAKDPDIKSDAPILLIIGKKQDDWKFFEAFKNSLSPFTPQD